MILDRLDPTRDEWEELSGWSIRPEGACKDGRCVPLDGAVGSRVDVRAFAARLGMPIVHDEAHSLWCVGPESGGHVLRDARLPRLVLPDLDGRPFDLASLRGTKVLLVAWASW